MDAAKEFRENVYTYISKLSPNSLVEYRAIEVFRLYSENTSANTFIQYPAEKLAAASVFIAAQDRNHPIDLRELGDRSKLGKFTKIVRDGSGVRTLPIPPGPFIERFAMELSISPGITKLAHSFAEDYSGNRTPAIIALSAIYLASKRKGEVITQEKLSKLGNISNLSIRECYQEMECIIEKSD